MNINKFAVVIFLLLIKIVTPIPLPEDENTEAQKNSAIEDKSTSSVPLEKTTKDENEKIPDEAGNEKDSNDEKAKDVSEKINDTEEKTVSDSRNETSRDTGEEKNSSDGSKSKQSDETDSTGAPRNVEEGKQRSPKKENQQRKLPPPEVKPPKNDLNKIVSVDRYPSEDGSYEFAFETENGQKRDENGHLKGKGTDDENIVVKGHFSYVAADGIEFVVKYIADEKGYRPIITVKRPGE